MYPAEHHVIGVRGGGLAAGHECLSCLMRQAGEAAALGALEGEARAVLLSAVERFLVLADRNMPAPILAQQVQRLIRQSTGRADLYAAVRQGMNELAARIYPEWHRRFFAGYPPLEAGVRLAIVGNLLDVAAKTQCNGEAMSSALEGALTQPLEGSVEVLSEALRGAGAILYLADNAGEIVFDRALLEQMPAGRFAVVVRGGPVLNDATRADAEWAGLIDLGEVITNGSDAPGTVLEDCSPGFRARFASADLVIAKGQGNYETLARADKHIFFLLKVKCPVVAASLGLPCGSLVLKEHLPVSRPSRGNRRRNPS